MEEKIQSVYEQFLKRFVPPPEEGFPHCTVVCKWLQYFYFKDAKICGYQHDDNPTAAIGEAEGGHDFLVIDGKYIVDFWYKEMYDADFPLLLPIEDAHKHYGDNTKWIQVD